MIKSYEIDDGKNDYIIEFTVNKEKEGIAYKEKGENGFGWKFTTREYYGCGKLNIIISDLIYEK